MRGWGSKVTPNTSRASEAKGREARAAKVCRHSCLAVDSRQQPSQELLPTEVTSTGTCCQATKCDDSGEGGQRGVTRLRKSLGLLGLVSGLLLGRLLPAACGGFAVIRGLGLGLGAALGRACGRKLPVAGLLDGLLVGLGGVLDLGGLGASDAHGHAGLLGVGTGGLLGREAAAVARPPRGLGGQRRTPRTAAPSRPRLATRACQALGSSCPSRSRPRAASSLRLETTRPSTSSSLTVPGAGARSSPPRGIGPLTHTTRHSARSRSRGTPRSTSSGFRRPPTAWSTAGTDEPGCHKTEEGPPLERWPLLVLVT